MISKPQYSFPFKVSILKLPEILNKDRDPVFCFYNNIAQIVQVLYKADTPYDITKVTSGKKTATSI